LDIPHQLIAPWGKGGGGHQRRHDMSSTSNFMNLPLFPLNTVLFPDGHLSLRVLEQRYMDMVSQAMRNGTDFGICLIASGQEVGQPAQPHEIGTIAHIDDWDMQQLGMLNIKVRGIQRF